jgi:protein-S-isoprenylcysteine O-methyltransferase Ste14
MMPNPSGVIATSRIATLLLVVAVVTLFLRHQLFARDPVSIALQVVAALLMLWARLTFGRRSFHVAANPTEGGLVTSGPYGFIRHPIYSAILLFVWAGVLSQPTRLSLLLALLASIAVTVRILTEENLVLEHYPEYQAYAAHTKRVIPFLL